MLEAQKGTSKGMINPPAPPAPMIIPIVIPR